MKCDGILGLSPGDMSLQDDERRSLRGNNTNRFIENLYEQGKIQERVFSFFLSEYNNYREIPAFTIGGYDIEKFAPNQTLTWNYVTDDTYWTVKLSQVSLGDRQIPLSTTNAILDTGTSYLAMPENEFANFLAYW